MSAPGLLSEPPTNEAQRRTVEAQQRAGGAGEYTDFVALLRTVAARTVGDVPADTTAPTPVLLPEPTARRTAALTRFRRSLVGRAADLLAPLAGACCPLLPAPRKDSK